MAECPASIVLRSEGVESSNIEKESGEKLCDNLQKPFESDSCVPSLEPVDPRASSKSDEKDSDEKLADNPQKLSESCVPSKGPFDPKANLKWEVGSHCKAVWSQDGLVYPASLVWLGGERCKVKFDNYGNEEEMDLSALLVEAADQPWKEKRSYNDEKESDGRLGDNPPKLMESKLPESQVPNKGPVDPKANSKVWMLGSRCRAVYSEDGLVYPAVLVWMRGEHCRVKFEGYGNEEELELSTLLSPDELGGHSGKAAAKAMEAFWLTSNNRTDWNKKKDREWKTPQQEGREEPSSPQPPEFPPGKDSYNLGNEQGDKKKPSSRKEDPNGRRQEPNNHPFPPVPPPKGSLDFLSLLPPPPPCVWPPRAGLVGAGDGLDSAVTDLSSMLLSWYLCGYHTGCYMAMQQTAASRKRPHKEKWVEE